ncbi:MAG: DMT family transporter [Candidatus Contendobacter sp.]|nr:DMT family transporter [Candidatus Contendobacter sp.]
MDWKQGLRQPGVIAALSAALLFGSGTPLAKGLLSSIDPWLLAGWLYIGSGAGLGLYRLARRAPMQRLPPVEWGWLAGAIFAGGAVGPVLLMFGLSGMPAAGAALLLNAEGVLTALLAWFVFGENFDRRIALGMLAIVAGALVVSWPGEARFSTPWPALAVVGACLAWAIDNNLTRKVSLTDATWIAMLKGWAAGSVNLALAFWSGAAWPPLPALGGALLVGGFAYGMSLALFVIGLRHLGTARTGAYFSVAPFFGAALAIPLLDEPLGARLLIAGGLMGLGVWLHLTEQHRHPHVHEPMAHDHEHEHDAHHQHPHDEGAPTGSPHRHWHRHQPLTHCHAHFPDAHHRHGH